MPQSYPDGTYRGSDGRTYTVRGGVVSAEGPQPSAPRAILSTPGDPYKAPQSQADLTGKNLSNERARVELDPTTIAANRAKAVADARKAGYDADAAAVAARKGDKAPASPANLLANDELLQTIARARQHLTNDSSATGGYAYLSMIPGTESKQLKNLLDTIRANVTFDRLQQMRNESTTGGAVGNASDNDMRLLGSTTAALDQSANASDISKSLDAIERRYIGLRADMIGVPREQLFQSYFGTGEKKKDEPVGVPSFSGGASPPSGGAPPSPDNGPVKGFDPRTLGGAAEGYAAPVESALTSYKDVPNPDKEKAYWSLVQFLNTNPSEAQVRNFIGGRPIYPSGLADDIVKYHAATNRYAIQPGQTSDQVPLTAAELDRNYTASRPDTVFYKNFTNDAAAGLPRALANSRLFDPTGARGAATDAADATHPNYATAGKIAGTTVGALAAELGAVRAARAFGLGPEAAARWAPRIADPLYGAVSGAAGDPNNPGMGAVKGGLSAFAGGTVGRTLGGAAASGYRPNVVDREISTAINASDPALVGNTLREAQGFNLPMTLADTSPQLGSIAGATVRRSPTAAATARAALRPRSLGQIDRLGGAIERDLGPIGNVPQISEDLQAAGRANAAPLYDAAYPQTVNDPAISDLLANPQLGDAVNAARMFREQDATLARARGLPEPPPLAEPGGPIDIRTIDYMKRGLDGRINTAFTGGDPQAAMSGPFLRDARRLMLNAADSAVPEYGAARAAYAGPMRAQEAMELGQGALRPSVTANQLGVDLAGVEPGNIPQAQLGYRSGMMDKANRNRYNANPWDSALGTPEDVMKLGTMYPGNPGNARLIRQRDLERQMQETTNSILGGSQTADRLIADNAFKGDTIGTIAGAGADAVSGAPINTAINAARIGARRMFGARADARAIAKADAMAPILLNPNADQSLAELARILAGMQRYNRASGTARTIGSISGVGGGLLLPSINGQ